MNDNMVITYRNKKKNNKDEKKEKKEKLMFFKFKIFMSKEQLERGIRRKKRVVTFFKILVIIAAIILLAQYVFMKYQMSMYNIDDGYTCVWMSYDAEKFFEGLGFNTVQRRVEGIHRWIAIELWDGMYVDYESTLNILGMHLVNKEMRGKPIQQSEGYFSGDTALVTINDLYDMHTKLKDWKVTGYVGYDTNIDFFKSLP
jgi:hypothetical protein